MTMKRAYSVLDIKAIDEEKREITGIATTPETDRTGDIVEPTGAEFTLPIPLLSQHDPRKPIGHVTQATVTDAGILITAKLVEPYEGAPQSWVDRINEAWADIKTGLVRGLSIGFHPLESTHIEGTYGMRFIKWLWLELSAVTIPANGGASIQTIKSIDIEQRAASGSERKGAVRLITPGDPGTKTAAHRRILNIVPRKNP
jgi:HK97 family phage prohead protease